MELAQSVADRLLQIADEHADKPALWVRNQRFTYSDIFTEAKVLASSLLKTGAVQPGDRVAFLANRTKTAYVSIAAALLAGATYVPLNPRFPVDRNRRILNQSGATALIIDDRNSKKLAEILLNVEHKLCVFAPESQSSELAAFSAISRDKISAAGTLGCINSTASAEDYAYILFTSGSTGVPKGVAITHGNLCAYVNNISQLVGGIGPGDRIIQLADLTFDISVHDIFCSWLNGAELYSIPEGASLMSTRFVQDHRLTGWFSVPSTAGLLNQAGFLERNALPSLRFALFCGEALTGNVAEAWCIAAPNAQTFNLYGPTEATVAFTAFRYVGGQAAPPAIVSLGHPFPDQMVGLFDPHTQQHVLPGETGEICLSGTQVSLGYWQAPELNAKAFFEANERRWYRTGDLGRYDEQLGFQFSGRVDHQVKIRGYRVELQEIETVVREATNRDVVAVIPWPADADGGARGCVAFVSALEVDEAGVRAACANLLPDYMIPSRVFCLPDMPLNSSGKVDYSRLSAHPLLQNVGD